MGVCVCEQEGRFSEADCLSGFSITIMKSDQKVLQRLDAATKAPCWPVGADGP